MNVVAGFLRSLRRRPVSRTAKTFRKEVSAHLLFGEEENGHLTDRNNNQEGGKDNLLGSKRNHHREKLIHKLFSKMKILAPQIIKGSLLGAVIFETYDKMMLKTNNNSFLSGATAGLAHGVCFQIWEGLGRLNERIIYKKPFNALKIRYFLNL